MARCGERAVVVGASMGGLLAARALSDSYDEVVVLERDHFPQRGEHRKGVPQSRHTHALLPRGREVLEELYPNLTKELADEGAPLAGPRQARRFIAGGYYCRYDSPVRSLLVSRPLLEAHVRARTLALPNVRTREGVDVRGLVSVDDVVAGVRIGPPAAPGVPEETLTADLVVDATGRGSRAPVWLEAMGYAAPEEERVEIGLGYASRLYRREPHHLDGDFILMVTPTPTCRRASVTLAQEGDRWIVTLVGYHGEHPPTDHAGFTEFARSLAAPDVYELVARAEPLGDAVAARFPANQRRRYERLDHFPRGLLVFGDAICSFNPMYGQGMTVAALQAAALRGCLAQGGMPSARRFFAAAARAVDTPWLLTVGNDRRFVDPAAKRSAGTRFLQWYVGKLHQAARHDPVAAQAFVRVTALLDPPPSMLRPRIAARVLWGSLRPGAPAAPGGAPAARRATEAPA
jgi:2-polyprenyl-6-methoxyphenol hydroxylase-like FAD-dependent oxidoreductase